MNRQMDRMNDDRCMNAALKEARKALARGDFPVGCVMVHEGRIVARGSREGTCGDGRNELDHAEMVALRRLAAHAQPLDPSAVTAFSTMEPCLMCYSAMMLHGIGDPDAPGQRPFADEPALPRQSHPRARRRSPRGEPRAVQGFFFRPPPLLLARQPPRRIHPESVAGRAAAGVEKTGGCIFFLHSLML
mgnify:CR=1 FL=1